MFKIHSSAMPPADEAILRLPHLTDHQLVDLIVDTRGVIARCGDSERDHLMSCLAWLELEFATRGLEAVPGVHEQGPAMIIVPKLLRATRLGEVKEIGRLVGALAPGDFFEAYNLASEERNPDFRFLALSALCVTLEAQMSNWESACSFAESYQDMKLSVDTRLRRIERRWGYLLGVLSCRAEHPEG